MLYEVITLFLVRNFASEGKFRKHALLPERLHVRGNPFGEIVPELLGNPVGSEGDPGIELRMVPDESSLPRAPISHAFFVATPDDR